MTARFVPLRGVFPKPKRAGVNPPFKTGHSETLRLLDRELRMVGAIEPLVQLALHEKEFNRNGDPYSGAIPEHPGVIVSFRKKVKRLSAGDKTEFVDVPLSFPCNTFRTWEANLRAIAIAMEDLRRIDRYGVSQGAEQYLGFRALPPPGPDHPEVMTVDAAARLICRMAGVALDVNKVIADRELFRDLYQGCAKKLHPDAQNHKPDEWAKLQAAKNLIELNFAQGMKG